jgi:hypothetical protein
MQALKLGAAEERDTTMNHSAQTKIFSLSRLILTGGFVLLSLFACSNKALYQTIQLNGLRACEQRPIFQQKSCKAQYQKDYATYKQERDALGQSSEEG